MYKYAGSDQIVDRITRYGAQTMEELCQTLGLRQQTISLYLRQPIADGVLVFDKVAKAGTAMPVRRYRLPTQPEYDPSRPFEEQSVRSSNATCKAQSTFGQYDPADPFGLVARIARGEKLTLPRSQSPTWDDDGISVEGC